MTKYRVGDVLTSKYGDALILERIEKQKAKIRWLDDYAYEHIVSLTNLYTGKVQNPYYPVVWGVGFLGVGYNHTEHEKAHSTWASMMARCFSPKIKQKKPTYKDVTVCKEWYNFQVFAEWYYSQKYSTYPDYQIDKDILSKGNKIYSPEYCVFVPREINMWFVNKSSARGAYPLGVYFHKERGKYIGVFKDHNRKPISGRFNTAEEAFLFSKNGRENTIKKIAELYKDRIDLKVYQALMTWTLEATD